MYKFISALLISTFALFYSCFFASTYIYAQAEINSSRYKIQMPNFNSGAGIPTSSNYKMNTTIGQTAPGLYSSTGYRVKAGFQYISSIIPFSFSISHLSIDLGSLLPQIPSTASETLTVSSGGAGGYQIKASENHTLQTSGGVSSIPNTSCDTSCSTTLAGVWNSSSSYGFGYNMSGMDTPSDFIDLTYYRPFADRSNSEDPQVVMSSSYVGRDRQATVTYKVNVEGSQPAGTYNNTIMYTAIPSY